MRRGFHITPKEETRVLVLRKLRNKTWLATVHRGKYWLDGVALLRSSLEHLAFSIMNLKYYGEIRIVMIDNVPLDNAFLENLSERLKLPVILFINNDTIYSVGLPKSTAKLLIKKLSLNGTPEPIRISRIISRDLSSLLEFEIYDHNRDSGQLRNPRP